MLFHGSNPALITPMTATGDIDFDCFERFVEWQIASGSHGLVPVGTTGESPTLSHQEHKDIIGRCIKIANGRVPVIAGTGSNNTAEAIELTEAAEKAGASAALVVVPYYNKPTQEGMYQHYKAVAEKAPNLPIIIYNIPGRSIVDMSVETMKRLYDDVPNIYGVKDATNDLARPLATRIALGSDFCQLSGEDGTIPAFLNQGGHGCISVTANIAPALCAEMHNAWQAKNLGRFNEIRDQLMPLHQAIFCESSPGPTKYALSLLGHCSSMARMPMVEISEQSKKIVKDALIKVSLLS